MTKLLRLLVVTVVTVGVCYVVAGSSGRSKTPASAATASWNPAVSCVPVVTTIEQIIGTQTNSNGGATQAGGWYGGQTIPDKTSLTPPCTVNGAPMFVELHNVNVEGMQCNSFTGGNDGDCWGNLWDNSTGSMTLLNQIHAEIAGTWITAGIAPSVPATNSQIDIQGFVYWDTGHLTDAWHSYSGWEVHPVSAWRATGTNDFSISVSPSAGTVTGGSSATATVSTTVTGGSSQQLNLAATGLPAGASVTFKPATISAGSSSVITITTGTSTPVGSYTVKVTASGSSTTHSVPYTLTVNGPASTSITNGGFETGSLSPWTPAGSASVTTASPHTGSYAAMVGLTTPTNGDSSITQSFLAPAGGGTLSFWYSINCQDTVTYDWGTASLTDNTTGTASTPLPHTCPSNTTWKQASATLTGGDYYTLSLINHDDNNAGDPTYTEYDDVVVQASTSLPAPSGLTATPASSTEIDLSWSPVSGATGYAVQRSPDGSTTWTTVGTPTSTSYNDTGLAAATTYYYRVSATNGGTTSPNSAVVSATTLPSPPLAPASLTATGASPTEIDLSWSASATATSYRIERSASSTTGWSTLTTVTAPTTSYADDSVSAGSTWYYRVFAIDSGGSSAASPVASAFTPPATPSGLTATPASSTEIDLTWSTAAGATGYTVQRSPDGSTGWTTIATPTGTIYNDTGLTSATTYYYRVIATTSSSASAPSTVVSAMTPPSTPTGLTATASAPNTISLQWNDVAGETGFTMQRSNDGTTWANLAAVGANVTSYTDTGLSSGSIYYYRVSAVDAGGSSAPSAAVSATATGTTPPQPTGVSASAASSSEIDIQWQSVSGATGYRVERSPDGSTGWTAIHTGTATTYSDLGLTAATTYYYRVFATNSSGDSPASATVDATTLPLPPAAPSNPAATAISGSQITVSWNDVAGETGFTVQRSPDGTSSWTTAGTTAQGVTSLTDSGLAASTTYYYRVLATNAGGSSSPSSIVSATTLSAAPPAPTGLRAAALSSTSTTVSWGASSGATTYQVQRSPNGSTWTTLTSTAQTSYNDTGLTAATTYSYRVIAANSAGTSPPSTTVSVTTFVAPCPCTGWAPTATPKVTAASDSTANELGVKFRVDLPGTITGLRFYKGTGNTGTHTAHVWSRTGTLLGSATFTNETATGWQQVNFSAPIAVAAATTYVASYFAPSGHYAADQNYFATQGVDNAPIHLLANGIDGYDGVYKQTTSGFPTYTYKASNYWVDIVFNANPPATPASVTASAQPTGQITVGWAAVTGASSYSISYSSDGVSGWTVIGSTSQTSWTDVRPTPGVANYYRVSAVSAGGTSAPSTVVSAVPTG
jgi:fibronectin type 3 domain-containing protein